MTDINRVEPYVSNLVDDVYVLRNLPEEVAAVLFAYYSRSSLSLRENLANLLAEGDLDGLVGGGSSGAMAGASERARAFHEKWTVRYGHKSVAEHAKVRLAVENCSILAAKALEDSRLGSYTEKSTRYTLFKEDSFFLTPLFSKDLLEIYQAGARSLMRSYVAITKKTTDALKQKFPTATDKQCQTKAFDLVRGILPAGALTNLGITLNGTGAEHHFSKLLAHPAWEVRQLAMRMAHETSSEMPTLLKYVEAASGPQAALEEIRKIDSQRWDGVTRNTATGPVRKLRSPQFPLWNLATMILLEAYPDMEYAEARFRTSLERDALPIVDAYLKNRGAHELPGRAFEDIAWKFEIICDYGAWRDLQRHRMVSQTTPVLTCNEGFAIDPLLVELGVAEEMIIALEGAEMVWKQLAAVNKIEAQYIVPLAYRVRYVLNANLRELFHIIELRSKKEGHPSYRKIAQFLAEDVLYDCSFLSPHLRVDKHAYDFARSA